MGKRKAAGKKGKGERKGVMREEEVGTEEGHLFNHMVI